MKHFKIIGFITVILIPLITFSCYYDSEEALYPSLPDKNCDTVNITYEKHISKIISDYCISCHGNTYETEGGGYLLDNYDDVVKSMYEIVIAIERSNPTEFIPMPKDAAKLSDCMINQFKIWEANGYPK